MKEKKMRLLKAILFALFSFAVFMYASNAVAEDYTQNVTAEWTMEDTTNLKEWKLFWSGTTGGPYEQILVIPYDPTSAGPLYTSPVTATVTGSPATTVTKYFVMIACGDIPQSGGSTEYKCSEDSNEATFDFWIPAGQFSVPMQFIIKAQ